jgi:hypothetical protein
MITAGEGVKLIGSYDAFGFDFTVNRVFGEDLTFPEGGNTGVNLIGKFRFTGSEAFKFGAGVATATGTSSLVFANGDRENYNLNPEQLHGNNGTPDQSKNTHAAIPGGTIAQADAKLLAGGADVDLWGGYGTASDPDRSVLFGGLGLKFDLSESFYAASRFTVASNQTDGANQDSPLGRIQIGTGYEIYDRALWKVEYVRQTEPSGSPGKIGRTWSGVTTELSFNF